MMKLFLIVAPILSGVLGLALPADEPAGADPDLAKLHGHGHPGSVDGRYVVRLKPRYSIAEHIEEIGVNVTALDDYHYHSFLPGYSAYLDDDTLHNKVRRDPGVSMVEADLTIELIKPVEHDAGSQPTASGNATLEKREFTSRSRRNVDYNLQMMSAANKLNVPVQYGANPYSWLVMEGDAGVDVYIMDTGIRTSHQVFKGYARNFGNLQPTDRSPYCDDTMADRDGHGTHVAGIVSSAAYYGVVDNVWLWNVKVLGNRASAAKMAQAISDIKDVHVGRKNGNGPDGWRGSVINLSLRIRGRSSAFDQAVAAARREGITLFAAAGNENENLSERPEYPCCSAGIVCVAGIDNRYQKWTDSADDGSAYGTCVDYLAPAKEIESASNENDVLTRRLTGTSMASPHVAGMAALFTSWLGLANGQANDFLYFNGRENQVTGFSADTRNMMVNSGIHLDHKQIGEPFRWAGQQRRIGIKTSNMWNDFNPQYPPVRDAENHENGPEVPAHNRPAPASENMPVVPVDAADTIASSVLLPSVNPGGPNWDPDRQKLSWNTLMYDGHDHAKTGCTGVMTTQAHGNGNSDCIKTQFPSSCIQAVVLNGTESCAVQTYSDDACKTPIWLYNRNPGYFQQGRWNDAMVAVTPKEFNSYDVYCYPK